MQVQQERDLLQQRSESAEAEIEELQTLHRREVRRFTKAAEQAQVRLAWHVTHRRV